MIKRLLAVLLLCSSAWATTTVSGNIKNLGTTAVSAGTFVRFYLRGCSGNLPRVSGTAIIAPTLGNVFYFDFVPNASGAISGTLYSTRDSTGLLGGDIECGGSTTAVWYGFVPFVNGKAGPETPIHAKNTATIDISNITPITTNPVIAAPTGDSTYCRVDGGNCDLNTNSHALSTGTGTFTGAVTAASVNTSVYVAPGGNIQTAINACPSGGCAIDLSPGTYTITTAILLKTGTHLRCTNPGFGEFYDTAGCVIQPSAGNAIWAIGPNTSNVEQVELKDITIDLTQDSSALGCVDTARTLYSEYWNVTCLVPALGAMDCFRWDGTVQSYWNRSFGLTCVSTAPGAIANTHNAFHYTAAANSNWCYGCVALLVNNAFLIDGATSQIVLFGGGSDHFGGNCISVQGTGRGNLAKGVRCEESFQNPTGAAVNIGATAVENAFEQIYVVGAPNAASVVTDSSGGKNIIQVVDTAGQYANLVWGNNSSNFQMGINKTPTQALDVNGRMNINNFIYETQNGLFRLDGNTNAGVEATVLACDATDTCRLSSTGAGGVFFGTTGGASAFGFNPTSFGNAFVPAADNTYQLGANTRRWSDVRFAGNIKPGSDAILISSTAPTIAGAGCGGSAATIPNNNGTAAFEVNVGSTPGSACTVTMPTAAHGWACSAVDVTTNSTSVFYQKQSPAASQTATQIVITNFNDVAAATAFVASDVIRVICNGY